jgi:hypothetical protein
VIVKFNTTVLISAFLSAGCHDPLGSGDLARFRFQGAPIHPGAVELLVGELADPLTVIGAVDLEGWSRCNAHEPMESKKSDFVVWHRSEDHTFGYRHVGKTSAGTHVLETYGFSGGGSGVWQYLVFARLEKDRYCDGSEVRERILLKSTGGLFMGDRESPEVELIGNKVRVGPSRGWFRNITEPAWFEVN